MQMDADVRKGERRGGVQSNAGGFPQYFLKLFK